MKWKREREKKKTYPSTCKISFIERKKKKEKKEIVNKHTTSDAPRARSANSVAKSAQSRSNAQDPR